MIGSKGWVEVQLKMVVNFLASTIFFDSLTSPDSIEGFGVHTTMKGSRDILPCWNCDTLLVFEIDNERAMIYLSLEGDVSLSTRSSVRCLGPKIACPSKFVLKSMFRL